MNRYAELKQQRKKAFDKVERVKTNGTDREFQAALDEVDRIDKELAPLAERREAALEAWASESQGGVPYQDPQGHSHHNEHMENYSLLRAVHSAASGENSHEREVSRDLARQSGIEPSGLLVPTRAFTNAIETTGSPGGSGLVPEQHQSFIDALRPRMAVSQLGATILSNLRGNISVPRQIARSSVGWRTEVADLGQESPEYDAMELTAKRAGAYAVFRKQLLAQSDPSIEQLLVRDLTSAVAIALDEAAISGSGSGGEPTGILSTSGVSVHPLGTDGSAPSYSDLIELVRLLSDADADAGALAFLSNPAVRAQLQGTMFDAGSGVTVYDKALALSQWAISTNVPSDLTKGTGTGLSAIIFGNFADVTLAQWGDFVDVTIDPFTEAVGGRTRVIVNAFVDVGIRRSESFAIINDAVTD